MKVYDDYRPAHRRARLWVDISQFDQNVRGKLRTVSWRFLPRRNIRSVNFSSLSPYIECDLLVSRDLLIFTPSWQVRPGGVDNPNPYSEMNGTSSLARQVLRWSALGMLTCKREVLRMRGNNPFSSYDVFQRRWVPPHNNYSNFRDGTTYWCSLAPLCFNIYLAASVDALV